MLWRRDGIVRHIDFGPVALNVWDVLEAGVNVVLHVALALVVAGSVSRL